MKVSKDEQRLVNTFWVPSRIWGPEEKYVHWLLLDDLIYGPSRFVLASGMMLFPIIHAHLCVAHTWLEMLSMCRAECLLLSPNECWVITQMEYLRESLEGQFYSFPFFRKKRLIFKGFERMHLQFSKLTDFTKGRIKGQCYKNFLFLFIKLRISLWFHWMSSIKEIKNLLKVKASRQILSPSWKRSPTQQKAFTCLAKYLFTLSLP